MSTREENIPPMMLAAEFRDAFMGVAEDYAGHPRAVYDYAKCVRILMRTYGFDVEQATDHMDFTVVGSYVGAATPIWCQRIRYSDIRIA
jgi:hypothetical protein